MNFPGPPMQVARTRTAPVRQAGRPGSSLTSIERAIRTLLRVRY